MSFSKEEPLASVLGQGHIDIRMIWIYLVYSSANQPGEPSAADLRREEIAQNKQQSRETQAINQAQCAAWQAEVDRLEPNRRVFYTNDKGETERMDDVERVNKVADLKGKIAANCR